MKDKILNIILSPILTIVLTIIFIFYLSFLKSNTYTSQSIISLKDDNAGAISLLQNPLLGLNASSNLDELKTFLISDEAMYDLKNSMDMTKFFGLGKADFFSAYKTYVLFDYNFKDYLQDKISILVDPISGTLLIESTAFSPEDALALNIKNIEIANNFLTKKQNLSSEISRINALCRLSVTQGGLGNINEIRISNKVDRSEISAETGGDLLLEIARQNSKNCQEIFEFSSNQDLSEKNIINSKYLSEIKSSSIKDILKQYYNNSVLSLTSSDKISIVSEPQKPLFKDKKNILLNSLLLLFGLFLVQISVNTIVRLYNEFL